MLGGTLFKKKLMLGDSIGIELKHAKNICQNHFVKREKALKGETTQGLSH